MTCYSFYSSQYIWVVSRSLLDVMSKSFIRARVRVVRAKRLPEDRYAPLISRTFTCAPVCLLFVLSIAPDCSHSDWMIGIDIKQARF